MTHPVAADVLEHVREPEGLLEDLAGRLGPGGSIVGGVPNSGTGTRACGSRSGRFDYDGAASSTAATCGSSPAKASRAWPTAPATPCRRRESSRCPSRSSTGGGSQPGEVAEAGDRGLRRAIKRIDRIGRTAVRPTSSRTGAPRRAEAGSVAVAQPGRTAGCAPEARGWFLRTAPGRRHPDRRLVAAHKEGDVVEHAVGVERYADQAGPAVDINVQRVRAGRVRCAGGSLTGAPA